MRCGGELLQQWNVGQRQWQRQWHSPHHVLVVVVVLVLATVGIRDAQSCCQRGSVSVKGRADEIASRADCRREDHQNNNATWKAGTRYCTVPQRPVSLSFAECVCLRLPDYENHSLHTCRRYY